MNRTDLTRKAAEIARVAYEGELIDFSKYPSLHDAKCWTIVILDALAQALVEENEIKLPKLGTFMHKVRPSTPGRNPITGEKVIVPAKVKLRFKAAPDIKKAVEALDPSSVPPPEPSTRASKKKK